jgi:hypothetical protein
MQQLSDRLWNYTQHLAAKVVVTKSSLFLFFFIIIIHRHKSTCFHVLPIYASFLRQQGIQPEIIDMLPGRIGKNIFLRHYLTPSSSYKSKVLKALEKLQRQLN